MTSGPSSGPASVTWIRTPSTSKHDCSTPSGYRDLAPAPAGAAASAGDAPCSAAIVDSARRRGSSPRHHWLGAEGGLLALLLLLPVLPEDGVPRYWRLLARRARVAARTQGR